MDMQQLDKSEWKGLCDRLSRSLAGKRAEIEVGSLGLGYQIEVEWLPLLGITYDPKNDIVDIALGDSREMIDHAIAKPRELHVQIGPAGLASILVVGSDGTRQLIQLRDPLMLPPPTA
jgi:hypothetical protein